MSQGYHCNMCSHVFTNLGVEGGGVVSMPLLTHTICIQRKVVLLIKLANASLQDCGLTPTGSKIQNVATCLQ